jgi:hypothetical protein
MTRSILTILGLATLFVMQLGSSCDSDTSVSYHEDHYNRGPVYVQPAPPPPPDRVYVEAPPPDHVYVQPPPPDRVYVQPPPDHVYVQPPPPDRVYVDHGHDDNLPRCIPRGFYCVKDEEGKIRWTAPDNGTFYLYDVGKDFLRYSGPVRRGQEVIIMPGDDIVYVDQRAVSHENLRHDARHRIYFAAGVHDTVSQPDRGDGHKTGGAGDPGRTVPKGSSRLASGRGDLVINAAPKRGTVFIYDEDNRNVIYTADLDRGNSLKLDVSKGTLYVNSKRYADVKVPRGHTLSLYLGDH